VEGLPRIRLDLEGHVLPETQPGEILDIATSGDRKTIAVAGTFGEVRVYNIADRARTALISNVKNPVYSVALNQDATRLVVGAKDGTISTYQLPDGKLLKSLIPVPIADSVVKSP